MDIAKNIKKLREERGLMQKEVANTVGVHPSSYSKMEKGEREFGIELIYKLAKYFGHTIDEPVHSKQQTNQRGKSGRLKTNEKVQLISQLDDEDKNAVYRIIDGSSLKTSFRLSLKKNLK